MHTPTFDPSYIDSYYSRSNRLMRKAMHNRNSRGKGYWIPYFLVVFNLFLAFGLPTAFMSLMFFPFILHMTVMGILLFITVILWLWRKLELWLDLKWLRFANRLYSAFGFFYSEKMTRRELLPYFKKEAAHTFELMTSASLRGDQDTAKIEEKYLKEVIRTFNPFFQ